MDRDLSIAEFKRTVVAAGWKVVRVFDTRAAEAALEARERERRRL
jgi:hypothetical protein